MARIKLANLFLLCIITQTTQCHPNWFYGVTNPQVTVIQCSTEFLWRYGTFCVKFPANWNTTNPNHPNPTPTTPAPPPRETPPPTPQNPAPPPGEIPPPTEDSPPRSTPAEEPTSSLVEIVNPSALGAIRDRPRRGIHLGPEFSLALPPLKPPLTLNFPTFVQTPPAPPPATVIVRAGN